MVIILALVLAAYASARGQEAQCVVTKTEFEALHIGMTYAEVVKLLGCDGEEITRSESRYASTVIYAWSGSKAVSLDATMALTFQNDKLVSKLQSGLRN